VKKILCLLLISFAAYADKKSDILELIRCSAVTEEVVDLIIPQLADCFVAESGKELQAEEVATEAKREILSDRYLEQFAAPFDELFSHDEIKTLLEYYKSDVMKRFFKNSMKTNAPIFASISEVVYRIINPVSENSEGLVISVSKENFKEEVEDSRVPVIVDFYSSFCAPCKVMAPIFAELSVECAGKVKFAKLNVDLDLAIAQQMQVRAMPTFLFIQDGKVVDSHVGLIEKEGLLEKIKKTFCRQEMDNRLE